MTKPDNAAWLSQDAYESGISRAERLVEKRLEARRSVVLCSHGPVIPELVETIRHGTAAHRTGLQRAASLATGDFAVFHLTLDTERPHLVEVEVHSAG